MWLEGLKFYCHAAMAGPVAFSTPPCSQAARGRVPAFGATRLHDNKKFKGFENALGNMFYIGCLFYYGMWFQFRNCAEIPPVLRVIYLKTCLPNSLFFFDLRQNLCALGVCMTKCPEQAPVTLRILNEDFQESRDYY